MLAACGATGSNQEASTSPARQESLAFSVDDEPSIESGRIELPAESEDPQPRGSDGVLSLALIQPDSFLPAEAARTDQSAVIISDLLYDGLTEAVGRDGELRPALARSWTADQDFVSWTFVLDRARNVTADAVVTSLEPLASTFDGDGPTPGVPARLAAGIRSVSAVDDWTINIELERSNAGLPWLLSGLPFSVVGSEGAGTGAYVVEREAEDGVRLRRQDGDSAAPPQVEISWVEDPTAGLELLEGGLVHGSVVPPVATPSDLAFNLVTSSVATRFYVLDPRSALLADPELAAAVRAVIEPAALAAEHPEGAIGDGLVPMSMAGYVAGACGDACAGRPEVVDTIDPPARPVEIGSAGAEQEQMAMTVADQLSVAGIPALAEPRTPEELASMIVAGGTDIFAFGWVAAASSADAVLPPLLTVDSAANVARIDDRAVSEYLDMAAVTADDQQRWGLLDAAHRRALESGRIVPVMSAVVGFGLADEVASLSVRSDGSLDLEAD